MKIFVCIVVLAACSIAEDKSEAKPAYTPQQKIELLTLERDMLAAQLRAMPADIAAQQASRALDLRHSEILKQLGVDPAKWTDDLMSFEFTRVPPPEKKPADAPKPPEKPAGK